MQFDPKSEKDLQAESLAPDGDYAFDVLEASDEKSKKSGNPMIKIKLGIYNGDAMRWHVYDYLLPAMGHKLRHFCDTAGLLAKYESGQLKASDCAGRSGKCRLVIQSDKSGAYPDKNAVQDYIARAAKPLGQAAQADNGPEDDVPFK